MVCMLTRQHGQQLTLPPQVAKQLASMLALTVLSRVPLVESLGYSAGVLTAKWCACGCSMLLARRIIPVMPKHIAC